MNTTETLSGCTGKRAYPSRRLASRAAKWSQRRYHEGMEVYFCKNCGKYHVGSTGGRESDHQQSE